MGDPPREVERQGLLGSEGPARGHNRCKQLWLGRLAGFAGCPGLLDESRGEAQQQQARTAHDSPRGAGLSQSVGGFDGRNSDRQPDDHGVHQSPGWQGLSFDGASSPLVGLGSPNPYHDLRDIHPGEDQRSRRQAQSPQAGQDGLDAEQGTLRTPFTPGRPVHDGPVCYTPQRTGPPICVALPRPRSGVGGCLDGLGGSLDLADQSVGHSLHLTVDCLELLLHVLGVGVDAVVGLGDLLLHHSLLSGQGSSHGLSSSSDLSRSRLLLKSDLCSDGSAVSSSSVCDLSLLLVLYTLVLVLDSFVVLVLSKHDTINNNILRTIVDSLVLVEEVQIAN